MSQELYPAGGITDTQLRATPVPVSDGSGSLTVDDGGSTISIDDGGGSITVDGTVAISGSINTEFPYAAFDSFGYLVTAAINNQVDIQFYRDTPANLVTVTTGSGGTATASGGMATFAATSTASSYAKGVTTTNTYYTANAEIYCVFTAAFSTGGGGTSYQRIGLYDSNNGFFLGYEGGTFKFTLRTGGADTSVSKGSWSHDNLTGAGGSNYTRAGTAEAIDLTKLNVWRIRFGWVGSAPIRFEVLSPDGDWILCHLIRQPNLSATPSIGTADLPVTCDVNSGNSGSALTIKTNCWCAGTTQALGKLNATLTDGSFARLTRSVLTGVTTGGGGGYVNVKVSPSGALTVDSTASVVSVIPGAGASNLGKAEDSPHNTSDVGVMSLAVRKDTATALAGTDGDYAPLEVDASGRLHVSASNIEKAEDAAHSSGDLGIMSLAVRKDTATALAGADGDYAPLEVDATGRLHVNSELPDAGLLSDSLANPTAPMVGAAGLLWNGSTWERQQSKITGTLLASGNYTTSQFIPLQTTLNARGVVVSVVITAAPGGGETMRFYLRWRDPLNNANVQDKCIATNTMSAVGTYFYELYPGSSNTAHNAPSQHFPCCVPYYWDVVTVHSASGTWTYYVSYQLIP